MFKSVLFCVTILASGESAIIQPKLRSSLQSRPTNIIVTMKAGIEPALVHSRRLQTTSRSARLHNLADSLEAHAVESQAPVMELLSRERRSTRVKSFWASNSVFVKDADADLVAKLAALEGVEEIHQEHIVYIEEPNFQYGDANMTTPQGNQWGIEKINAQVTWESGNRGEGIIVGSIDTGVHGTHDILKDNWVGVDQHGWYDPYEKSALPNDGNGHGTHTMGTIAGGGGYGVAPGAKWLSCKGCSDSGCTEEALLGCGQYTLCPTDVNGENRNCAMAPHLSSNSWGGGSNDMWYMNIVKAWREAGIIPVFAQGNSGPQCGTANSPGDYDNVIGVGASTSSDSLATFSSVGPTSAQLMKPDMSAPGQQIKSAWYTGDDAYSTISGTSMACPHVAGAVALLMAHDSTLEYDGIYNALIVGTSQSLSRPNKNCGGIQDSSYPNNMFGWGVIHTEMAIGAIGEEPPAEAVPEVEYFLDALGECLSSDTCWWGSGLGYCIEACDGATEAEDVSEGGCFVDALGKCLSSDTCWWGAGIFGYCTEACEC